MDKYLQKNFPIDERVEDLLSKITVKEKLSLMCHTFNGIERLNIPGYAWWNEALHGIGRAGKTTLFPQPIGLGASFNKELVYEVYNAISDEGRAKSNHAFKKTGNTKYTLGITFWTPNINIFRDPRWGRGQETYGEDPYLTKTMGVEVVKALQGDYHCDDYTTQHQTGKYLKTSACAKHYAVHSGPEYSRHEYNAKPSTRDFKETYLPAFKALADAGVETFMTCYNRVYDEVAAASELLVNDILRGEWNFHGQIVSDCWAIKDIHENHKVAKTAEDAVAIAIKAGCDLNCGNYYQDYGFKAYENGKITEEDINKCVRRNLRSMFKLGILDQTENVPYNHIPYDVVCSDKHKEISYRSAVESFVLLKNDNNLLPLSGKSINSVIVTGPFAADIDVLLGNYYGIPLSISSLLEGMSQVCSQEDVKIDYRKGALPYGRTLSDKDWTISVCANHDCTVIAVGYSGLLEGEEGDPIAVKSGDRTEIELPEEQRNFLDRYFATDSISPTVLVVFGGSPVALGPYAEKADAILFVWYPGQEGGRAMADVIFGKHSPSGRLPMTFHKSLNDIPDFEDYTMDGRTYKYLTKDPEFPFGFGLSYADFSYDNLQLVKQDENEIIISIDLTNNTNIKAHEVTQVYVKDNNKVNGQPHLKLCAFTKTYFTEQQTQTLQLTISKEYINYYNNDGDLVTPTDITIFCGATQPDPISQNLTQKPITSLQLTL